MRRWSRKQRKITGNKKDWKELEEKLDYRFKDKALLRQAFIHRSYLNESADPNLRSYERLEFLGDKVIALIASQKLYQEFWQRPEGELTKYLAMVVNNRILSKIARKLELGSYLFLGFGEERNGGRTNLIILADVFESLAGAVFLDGGWRAIERVLENYFWKEIPTLISQQEDEFDPKSKLQHLAQEKFQMMPDYKILEVKEGKFNVGVYLDSVLLGEGVARNKHRASVRAAMDALRQTKNLTNLPIAFLKKRDVIKEILYE